jgi:hypothetical protein
MLGNNHFLISGGGGRDYHCGRKKKFQNLPQSKYLFLMRRKAFFQLGTKKKWSFKTGDLLKEVQFT